MKLSRRYSRTTCWMDYQGCRERLEDEHGKPVPWWSELILATMVPLLIFVTWVLEWLVPEFAQ